jgi:hypothetical protein
VLVGPAADLVVVPSLVVDAYRGVVTVGSLLDERGRR